MYLISNISYYGANTGTKKSKTFPYKPVSVDKFFFHSSTSSFSKSCFTNISCWCHIWIFCRIANPTLYNSTSFSIPTITNSPVSSSARTSEWASGAASSSASTPPGRTPGTGSASGSAPSSWPATPQPPTWDPLSSSKRGSPSSLSPSQDSYEIRPEIRL